jgi:hypothetical protein
LDQAFEALGACVNSSGDKPDGLKAEAWHLELVGPSGVNLNAFIIRELSLPLI